jgi:hypothetical protein
MSDLTPKQQRDAIRIDLLAALGMNALRDWDDAVNVAKGIRKERDALRAEVQALRARGIVLPEVGADRIVETVTAAINVGASVRQEIVDLLAVWSKPEPEWRQGDVALDRTDFVWVRFETGWRTYPRDRGVQYSDEWLTAGLGPLTRLERVPDGVDRLGAISRQRAAALRQEAGVSWPT